MSEKFHAKKRDILNKLSEPDENYEDASPKGSVDEAVRDLVNDINSTPGFVTTSSCSGRIAVFLEGPPKARSDNLALSGIGKSNSSEAKSDVSASAGGKGGGRWLFTSHEKLELDHDSSNGTIFSRLGFSSNSESCDPQTAERVQYVHFKFEPMILHILTESVKDAQHALNAALFAGFRESGISGVLDSKGRSVNPMVAIRSSGLGLDSIVGFNDPDDEVDRTYPMVSEPYLRTLIQVANERFLINAERMNRFQQALKKQVGREMSENTSTFEPRDVRKERKRKEGLLRQKEMPTNQGLADASEDEQIEDESLGLDVLEN